MPAERPDAAPAQPRVAGAVLACAASPSLTVAWDAPDSVGALMSTRNGGTSAGAYDSLNLGDHVGDTPAAVATNRARWSALMSGAQPAWLKQVHGAVVVDAARVLRQGRAAPADGSWTREPGVACVVQVADCLPVLFAARNGRAVGAAHAGWRGLAMGVVERTALAVAQAAGCGPDALSCWLGPCIGPARFEVGTEVVDAFGGGPRFVSRPRADGQPRWLADLPGLTRDRMQVLGLRRVSGGTWCTVEDPSSFFSFRRDGVTGRMAAAVWLRP
jgi:YfiH family protein